MKRLVTLLCFSANVVLAGSFVPTNNQIMAGAYAYNEVSASSNGYVRGGVYTSINVNAGGLITSATVSNWVELPDLFAGKSLLTVAAWIKRGPSGEAAWISRKGVSDLTSVLIGPHTSADGKAFFWVANGFDSYGTTPVAGNDWHYYCMVYDGSQAGNAKVLGYVDGIQQTLTYSGTLPTSIGNISARTSIVLCAYEYELDDSKGGVRDFYLSTNAISSNAQFAIYQQTVATNYNAAWPTNAPGVILALSLSRYWDSNSVVAGDASMNREAASYYLRMIQ